MREAVIVDAVRTPVGRRDGVLKSWHPVDLLAHTLKAVVQRNKLDPAIIDDVIAGCVVQAGEQAYNVARNAVLSAGFPESVPGTTVDRQCVALSNGGLVRSRLVVIATGLGRQLLGQAGIAKTTIHKAHVLGFGFDIEAESPAIFDTSVLVAHGERPIDKIDYLTLFAIETKIRANLFTYHDPDDPWTQSLRQHPLQTLRRMMPRLEDVTGQIRAIAPVEYRVVDLAEATGHRRAGVVLIGDAFQTSSPAAGTGVSRVLNDIHRLCEVHVPVWLATDGMNTSKISKFYDDPIKQSCDAEALRLAGYRRAVTVETGLGWRAHRGRVALQNLIRSRLERLARPRPAGQGGPSRSWLGGGIAPPPLH